MVAEWRDNEPSSFLEAKSTSLNRFKFDQSPNSCGITVSIPFHLPYRLEISFVVVYSISKCSWNSLSVVPRSASTNLFTTAFRQSLSVLNNRNLQDTVPLIDICRIFPQYRFDAPGSCLCTHARRVLETVVYPWVASQPKFYKNL